MIAGATGENRHRRFPTAILTSHPNQPMQQTGKANPRRVWATRVDTTTVAIIDQLAYDLGYRRRVGEETVGNTGRMLDAIAKGEIIVHKKLDG